MNRFLKKESDEFSIPEESYRRARDRAWARITAAERPVARIRRFAPAAALAAAAALAIWIRQGTETREVPDEPPRAPVVAQRPPTPVRAVPPVEAPAPRAAQMPVRRRPAPPVESAVSPSRLVLNFVLPDSGVRMIWIMDKEFDLSGGME